MKPFQLDGLQPLWDKTIVDESATSADFCVGEPIKRESVFVADSPWEAGKMNYTHVFKDGDVYKMYYLAHYCASDNIDERDLQGVLPEKTTIKISNTFICYAESKDGLHWIKPNLGICSCYGSKENNIILRSIDLPEPGDFFDNFFVFKDTNPNCKKEERYKALAYSNLYKLAGWVSADGLHWTRKAVFDIEGYFDTLNVCFYNEKTGKYNAYVRSFHDIPADGDINRGKRDVRFIESEDFLHWSAPKLISFGDLEDYPLYTNNIMRYYRNPNILIGFPTRYVERFWWTKSFDELCGKEDRLKRMKQHPRMGLTVTDCVFISGRDGKRFNRVDEALFSPAVETPLNWGYGDGYPAYYLLETLSDDGVNKEISMFLPQRDVRSMQGDIAPTNLYRYTLRIDGFAYYKAKYQGGEVVTKPFIYEGNELRVNFSTSARGGMWVILRDEDGNELKTCEYIGNSIEKRIIFEDGEVADFAGKPVTLTFELRDAKLYAFQFLNK
ncbi:MAG: hypothetical protein IJX87_04250 [Clostridia bacterium]|nr:hypothetical protein [Clostridia bacterium]